MMKRRSLKLLSLAICLAMVTSLLPMTVFAYDNGYDYDTEYYYSYDNGYDYESDYDYDYDYDYVYDYDYDYVYVCECEYECENVEEEEFIHILALMEIEPLSSAGFVTHQPGDITLSRAREFADWTFSFGTADVGTNGAYIAFAFIWCDCCEGYAGWLYLLPHDEYSGILVFPAYEYCYIESDYVPFDPSWAQYLEISVIGLEDAFDYLYPLFHDPVDFAEEFIPIVQYLIDNNYADISSRTFPITPPAVGVGGGGGGGGMSAPPSTRVTLYAAEGATAVDARVTWGRVTISLTPDVVTDLIAYAVEAETDIVFDLSAVEGLSRVMMSRRAFERFASAGVSVVIMTDLGNIVISPQIAGQIADWAPASHFSIVFEDGRFVVASGLERLVVVWGAQPAPPPPPPPAPPVEEEDDDEVVEEVEEEEVEEEVVEEENDE